MIQCWVLGTKSCVIHLTSRKRAIVSPDNMSIYNTLKLFHDQYQMSFKDEKMNRFWENK